MKKKVALALLLIFILGSVLIYVAILELKRSPRSTTSPTPSPTLSPTPQTTYYNTNAVANYLETYTTNPAANAVEPHDVAEAMDAFDFMNHSIPNLSVLFQYLDDKQGADGTWETGQGHYVAYTARILAVYIRHGEPIKRSLDPFFSTIDTWTEVNASVNKYDAPNYWGGLWGYVQVWILYKNQAPPWVSDYLNAINTQFDDWANKTHQRNHVLGALLALGEDIPRKADVLSRILEQQNVDGGWGPGAIPGVVPPAQENKSKLTETYPSIVLLKNVFESNSTIENSIERGFEFIKTNYQVETSNGKMYASWSDHAGEKSTIAATAGAIIALSGENWQSSL